MLDYFVELCLVPEIIAVGQAFTWTQLWIARDVGNEVLMRYPNQRRYFARCPLAHGIFSVWLRYLILARLTWAVK
jgi:hypothetical protein